MATVLPTRRRTANTAFEVQMKWRRLIAALAIVLLLEQSMIGLSPFSYGGIAAKDTGGDVLRQVLMVGILGMQFLVPRNARPPMAIPVSLLVLLGFCLLTCTWAIAPEIALRRLAYTVLVIWILVRAIGDLGAVRALNVVRASLFALLVINYAVVLFTPYGIHSASLGDYEGVVGDWRGIMTQKNAAGAACALTVILFAFDRSRIPWLWSGSVIAASLLFLLMTSSKTSIAMLAIAGATGAVLQLYNPRHRSLVVPLVVMAGIGLIGLAIMYVGAIQNVLDDPGAFTGRAQIWPLLLEYSGEHLWKGAGYMSFWQIGEASPIWTLTNNWVAAEVGHGHNGYLDILVTLGVPGLILTVGVLFVWPAMKLLYSVEISRARRGLFAALMMFSFGHNMTESTLVDRASVVHVFLMIAVILIHRLSSQSSGAHQAIRQRLVQFADRKRMAKMRARHARRPRFVPPSQNGAEDGIA